MNHQAPQNNSILYKVTHQPAAVDVPILAAHLLYICHISVGEFQAPLHPSCLSVGFLCVLAFYKLLKYLHFFFFLPVPLQFSGAGFCRSSVDCRVMLLTLTKPCVSILVSGMCFRSMSEECLNVSAKQEKTFFDVIHKNVNGTSTMQGLKRTKQSRYRYLLVHINMVQVRNIKELH